MVEEFDVIRSVRICDADGFDTEVYILDCEGGLILVDVGFTSECQLRIQSELDSMGKSWEDVKMIIITHAHGDHIDNLQSVKELTDAEVVIGRGDEESLFERTGIQADVILGQGDLIGACGGIEIIHVPGHSPGNLCLYLRKYKAIIAGDSMFGDSEGNLEAPPMKYCSDVEEATENLNKLKGYDFDKILLSHGKNTYENAKVKLLELIARCN
jgi:glyoxylase-like metal-dependent hydrolase (beta-lactamase superfamily II)